MDDLTDTELLIDALTSTLAQRLKTVTRLETAFSAAWQDVKEATKMPVKLIHNYPGLLDVKVTVAQFADVSSGHDAMRQIAENAVANVLRPVVDDWIAEGLRGRLRDTCLEVLSYAIEARNHHAAGLVSETMAAQMQDAIDEVVEHGTVGPDTRSALTHSMGVVRQLLLHPTGRAVASLGGVEAVSAAHDRAHRVVHLQLSARDRFEAMLSEERFDWTPAP